MPKLHQYDYIFAIGLIFAALDAYNIGANDGESSWRGDEGSLAGHTTSNAAHTTTPARP
jgi:hypothetical protein